MEFLSSAVTNFITEYRGIFVTLFILPVSFCFDLFWAFSRMMAEWRKSPEKHGERVKKIQDQVKAAKGRKMCTGRPGWLAMSLREGLYKKKFANIYIDLYDVLELNTEKRTVRVEPGCSMGQVTAYLSPRGWALAVTPELDDLTVGGLINGFGVETSSHIHGLFQHICVSYEIVTPDGELIHVTKDNHPELFATIPWSHGTLGFLVAAELKIMPAHPFIELEYIPCKSKQKYLELFEQASNDKTADFVECLTYSPDTGVVMIGRFTDQPKQSQINKIGQFWKPWFYKHCEEILKSGQKKIEYIPIRDYYHRHTRSLFWELEYIIPFGHHPLFRYLLGWLGTPHPALMKFTQTESLRKLYENHHVVQDMLIPMNKLGDSLDCFDREFDIYPLWLCPILLPASDPKHLGLVNPTDSKKPELFVDVGAYGVPRAKNFKAVESTRRVEHFVRENNGFQALYADCYMTREEFRQMFDHKLYDQVRHQYACYDSLPEIYDKVSKAARR